MVIYNQLNQVLPTTLDCIIIFIFTSINIFAVQFGISAVSIILNLLLLLKDIFCIACFIYYEDNAGWAFYSKYYNWGYMFLRNPFFLELLISMLNIFVLRFSFFKYAFGWNNLLSDFWYYRLSLKNYLVSSSLKWLPLKGNDLFFFNTGLATFAIYFFLQILVLLPHFLTGLLFFFVGFPTFFVPVCFYFILDKVVFKYLANNYL